MKKVRSPDLTDEIIRTIIDLLDGWQGKLTWSLLLSALRENTGIEYSRFTFADYPTIANAFSLRKKTLRGSFSTISIQPRDQYIKAAMDQVARYRTKVERLEQENQLLIEQFITWAINAERKGVTVSMLSTPLHKPSRDRSKVGK